jgi:hypothetical protein
MTHLGGGFSIFGRDDAFFGNAGIREKQKQGQMRGLSAAAALPPSIEMTHFLGWRVTAKEKAKATANAGVSPLRRLCRLRSR